MRMYDIIRKKRDGEVLTNEEIAFFVKGYTEGSIPDYQASALCMAIFYKGMTHEETVALTQCMATSGDTVDLSRFGTLSVDKHSTGGVGDKTTLIVAPIVASLGGKVAKMSGRGLGHTGGTVDKLESIPGYKTSLAPERFMEQVEKIGVSVIGQTGNLTPADKKLYALRDVTATVDSIPMIVSSIMSKKLAAGCHSIVLDVKVGSGAFMKTLADAEKLAGEMVSIGKSCGRNIAAVLTDMDRPLGSAVGNVLEVIEAIEVLKGNGPEDLREVCVALATEMVTLYKGVPVEEAKALVLDALTSGKAYAKMVEWVTAQGGDPAFFEDPNNYTGVTTAGYVAADKDGYIQKMDTELIGDTAVILGAGRATKEDSIDPAAGIMIEKKTGDYVKKGEFLCRLRTNAPDKWEEAVALYRSAVVIGDEKPEEKPLIYKIIR